MGSDSQYFFGQGSALPPDVRRWLCPALTSLPPMGSAPGAAFGLMKPKRVIAPDLFRAA